MKLQLFMLVCFNLHLGMMASRYILEKKGIASGGQFRVTCSAETYGLELDFQQLKLISLVELSRRRICTTGNVSMAVFKYTVKATVRRFTHPDIPAGKNWTVDFIGGDSDQDTLAMKIVATIYKAEIEDSGHYICKVGYIKITGQEVFASKSEFIKVGWEEPLLSKTQVKENEEVTFTCRLFTFPVPEQTTLLTGLKVEFLKGQANCRTSSVIQLAVYNKGLSILEEKNRDWTVDISKGISRQESCMKVISIKIRHVKLLEHMGYYTCNVRYNPHNGGLAVSKEIGMWLGGTGRAQPVLDRTDVSIGDPVTATCDINRFDLYPGIIKIFKVKLSLNTKCFQSAVGTYSMISSDYKDRIISMSKNIPPKRNWTVTIGGENLLPKDEDTRGMKVFLSMGKDVTFDESGGYHCYIVYSCPFNQMILDASASSHLTVTGQVLEDIVTLTTEASVSHATLTCDIQKVPHVQDFSFIYSVEISRKLYGNYNVTVLLQYRTFGKNLTYVNFPANRNWNYEVTDIKDPRLRGKIIIKDLQCEDAGEYTCAVSCVCTNGNDWGSSRTQRLETYGTAVCTGFTTGLVTTATTDLWSTENVNTTVASNESQTRGNDEKKWKEEEKGGEDGDTPRHVDGDTPRHVDGNNVSVAHGGPLPSTAVYWVRTFTNMDIFVLIVLFCAGVAAVLYMFVLLTSKKSYHPDILEGEEEEGKQKLSDYKGEKDEETYMEGSIEPTTSSLATERP